jgi:hypothetical protein
MDIKDEWLKEQIRKERERLRKKRRKRKNE